MTEQHTCLVGYDRDYDYVIELSEGDELPRGATLWNYCPECGRHHGAADKAAEAQAAARERALLALPPIAPDSAIWGAAMDYVWSAIGARQRGLTRMAEMYESRVRLFADRALSGFAPTK